MKKTFLLIFLVVLITSFSTAQAEIKEDSYFVTPFWGISVFERNQSIHKNSNFGTYGLQGGYHFTKNISLAASLSSTQVELDTPQWYNHPWQDIYRYGVECLYHIMPDGPLVPYITLGLGGIHYTKGLDASNDPETYEKYESDRFAVDYGAGLKFFLTENIALQADVRHSLSLNSRQDNPHHIHNDLLTSFGINFNFGGVTKEKPPVKIEELPAPAPVDISGDSDKDGIPNHLDKCPQSPAGVAVDPNGCIPDSDNDGILDYEDHCPGSPEDAKVDSDGCPPDTDFDGVSDYKDKCPRTPHGAIVGEDGCPSVTKKTSILLKLEFDPGQSFIRNKYHKEIKKVADFMKKNSDVTATIIGHTDNIGNRENNIKLSKDRANSVRSYLIKYFGINASRLKAIGYGPARPIASNKTRKGQQRNRRVEATFETVH